MSEFNFSLEPPRDWDARCAETGAVIGTTGWQGMLETSFGCQSIYAWNNVVGTVITAFKAGPFSVGYAGFPAGVVIGDATRLPALLAELKSTPTIAAPACARVAVSAFSDASGSWDGGLLNPETAITNLQDWDLMSVSKNLRRDIRKAERSGLSVSRTTDASRGPTFYAMYESAVKHHGGSLRYNEAYFVELLELSSRNSAIRVYEAVFESDVAGFAAVVHHGDTAYYLHGGSSSELRRLSPSDLILSEAIDAAKAQGCGEFNFMASPPDQPTLVRYKEKWGGQTGQLRTVTIPTAATYPLFRVAEYLYRLVS